MIKFNTIEQENQYLKDRIAAAYDKLNSGSGETYHEVAARNILEDALNDVGVDHGRE